MAILTKAQLEALNQSSFADNTTGAITPEILRTYNSATIESLVDSLDTGSYTTDSEFNAFTSSVDAKFATIGSQSGSWGGGGTINTGSLATTGSNTFTGDQTIQSGGTQNGIFFKTGSSEFFVGQRENGNLSVSSSVSSTLIDINPSSGWIEVGSPQTNFNAGVSFRSLAQVRNITTDTGNGYVAQFDGFTASLQEGYAWVGKSGGTSVSVPTSSFAGATPVGVATTGSNSFVGDQTITGSVNISGGEHLFIKRAIVGAQQELRLGSTDNGNNFAFIVTGSDQNPGQQVWGINVAGNTWGNSFDAGVVFNSYVTASNGIRIQDGGTFSAPLQQGYVWAGDSNGRTQAIPTSSFGGGGSTFPYTGNAQITGSLGISDTITINKSGGNGLVLTNSGINSAGTIVGTNNIQSLGQFAGINIQGNAQGSGSQYPGLNMIVAPNTYPTDIFGGFSILTEQGALAGSTFLGLASSTYTPQYGGTNVPTLIANGNNPAGNDTAMIWKADGTAEHWKKSDFKYGINVTGSTEVASFTSSLQQGYAFVGGANGRTTTVPTSSFGGGGTIVGYATTGSNTFTGSQNIIGAVTASEGINSLGNIVILNGGGVGLQSNAAGSGSAFASITSKVDNTTDPSNVYCGIQLVKENGDALLNMAVNSYSPQYSTALPMILADGNNPDGNNTAIIWTSNGQAEHWKKSSFKYGVELTGSVNLTPASVSSNTSYVIPFISGSTISKDSVDTLLYNPSQNALFVSASTGNSRIGNTNISISSGSQSTSVGLTTIVSVVEAGQYIALSGNPSKTGAPSLTTSTKPGILALSSSAQPYVAIELQPSASFTDGRVTIKRPLVVEQGITGSTVISGSTTIVSPGGTALTLQNGGLNSAGTILAQSNIFVNNGSGITLAQNQQNSGSQYNSVNIISSFTETPTDIYSGLGLLSSEGANLASLVVNSYSSQYSGTPVPMIIGAGNNPDGSDTAIAFTSNGNMDVWKKTKFKYEATFTTGSNKQAGIATLDGGNPGTVTVSNSLVTSNSIIMLTKQSLGNTHSVAVTAKSAGSFTITSTGNGDSDQVGWFIINNS